MRERKEGKDQSDKKRKREREKTTKPACFQAGLVFEGKTYIPAEHMEGKDPAGIG